ARPCQGRGREFESRFPLHIQQKRRSVMIGVFVCALFVHLPEPVIFLAQILACSRYSLAFEFKEHA
ncbi:hypothetical protein ACK129_31465, partial [Pseudomonas citrulli]|uniref:hypothetical protein n=1 Tax=Pseudomonas citrulli TaxID=3064347 RepID=UPI003AC3AAA2